MSESELPFWCEVQIVGLLVSPVHRFEGRPGDGPLPLPLQSAGIALPLTTVIEAAGEKTAGAQTAGEKTADGKTAAGMVAGGSEAREWVEVRSGLGVVGDRYFGREAHRRASVTLMAVESVEAVQRELGVAHELDPLATRRNVLVRGADIDRLVGQRFSIEQREGGESASIEQPTSRERATIEHREHRAARERVTVEFQGHHAANPCAWMNIVLAEGAHRALRGRGGVRSEPLTDGLLRLGPAVLRSAVPLQGEESGRIVEG